MPLQTHDPQQQQQFVKMNEYSYVPIAKMLMNTTIIGNSKPVFFQDLPAETTVGLAELLLRSEILDTFLGTKFPTLKRYGLEGAESMLAFFHELLKDGDKHFGTLVIGMTHRGRLNLLTCLLGVEPSLLFRQVF